MEKSKKIFVGLLALLCVIGVIVAFRFPRNDVPELEPVPVVEQVVIPDVVEEVEAPEIVQLTPLERKQETARVLQLYKSHTNGKGFYPGIENINPVFRMQVMKEMPRAEERIDVGIWMVTQEVYLQLAVPAEPIKISHDFQYLGDGYRKIPDEFRRTVICTVDLNRASVSDCNYPFNIDFSRYEQLPDYDCQVCG